MKNNTMNAVAVNKEELKEVVNRLNVNANNRNSFKRFYIDNFTMHIGIEDRYKMNLILEDIRSIIEAIDIDFNNLTTNALIEDIMNVLESEDENELEQYRIAFRMVMGMDLDDFIRQINEDILIDDDTLVDVLSAEFSTMYLFYKANYESSVTPHGLFYIDKRINPSTLPDDYYPYDLVKCDSSSDLVVKPLLSTDPHDPLYFGSIISDEEIDFDTLVIRAVNLLDCLKFSIDDDTFIRID